MENQYEHSNVVARFSEKERTQCIFSHFFVGQVEENLMSYLGQTLAPKMVKKKKKRLRPLQSNWHWFNKEVMKILKELSQLTEIDFE